MDISSLTGTNNVAGGDASAEDRASVEKEGFLKLLIAQLSNQDPMAPQDSEKYVQQFTQFSMLEQMMNLNKGVEGLSLGQISNNTQEAVRFVGRSVVAKVMHCVGMKRLGFRPLSIVCKTTPSG